MLARGLFVEDVALCNSAMLPQPAGLDVAGENKGPGQDNLGSPFFNIYKCPDKFSELPKSETSAKLKVEMFKLRGGGKAMAA